MSTFFSVFLEAQPLSAIKPIINASIVKRVAFLFYLLVTNHHRKVFLCLVIFKGVFLYLRGTASIYLIGGKGSGADSLLNAIGVRDVGAENLKLPFNALSSEELIKLQPDVLLLMTKGLTSVGGISGLLALPGIAQTPAGQHKRVVTVDDSLLLSFGPRTVPMAQMLRPLIIAAARS